MSVACVVQLDRQAVARSWPPDGREPLLKDTSLPASLEILNASACFDRKETFKYTKKSPESHFLIYLF